MLTTVINILFVVRYCVGRDLKSYSLTHSLTYTYHSAYICIISLTEGATMFSTLIDVQKYWTSENWQSTVAMILDAKLLLDCFCVIVLAALIVVLLQT